MLPCLEVSIAVKSNAAPAHAIQQPLYCTLCASRPLQLQPTAMHQARAPNAAWPGAGAMAGSGQAGGRAPGGSAAPPSGTQPQKPAAPVPRVVYIGGIDIPAGYKFGTFIPAIPPGTMPMLQSYAMAQAPAQGMGYDMAPQQQLQLGQSSNDTAPPFAGQQQGGSAPGLLNRLWGRAQPQGAGAAAQQQQQQPQNMMQPAQPPPLQLGQGPAGHMSGMGQGQAQGPGQAAPWGSDPSGPPPPLQLGQSTAPPAEQQQPAGLFSKMWSGFRPQSNAASAS